jgi:hypothetical protein
VGRFTSASSSWTRDRNAARDCFPLCVSIASPNWSTIRITGFSEFIDPCGISDISVHRLRRNAASSRASTSSPFSRTDPPTIRPGGEVSRRTAIAAVDLPDPDSPTRPSVSPRATENDTPFTAITSPPCVR